MSGGLSPSVTHSQSLLPLSLELDAKDMKATGLLSISCPLKTPNLFILNLDLRATRHMDDWAFLNPVILNFSQWGPGNGTSG